MSNLDDREKGFENKFAHDEEFEFKARARRNKLVALWAAKNMDLNESESESYVSDVISVAVEGVANESVLNKIISDFAEKDVSIDEDQITAEMDRLLAVAKEQLK